MNYDKEALSACVVKGLPNVSHYFYKSRELLLEEKRQELLATETETVQQEHEQQEDSNQYEQEQQDNVNFENDPDQNFSDVQ
jgi:hypothetical protein